MGCVKFPTLKGLQRTISAYITQHNDKPFSIRCPQAHTCRNLSLPELHQREPLCSGRGHYRNTFPPHGAFLLIRKPHLGRWKSSLHSHPPSHPQHSTGKCQCHGSMHGWLSLGAWVEQCFLRGCQTVHYCSCSNQSLIRGITVTHSNFPNHLCFLHNLNSAWKWKQLSGQAHQQCLEVRRTPHSYSG